MPGKLLTRDEFREGVFARDKHKCVHCGNPGVDAHHILERRLFPDGGYYLDNGVTLCANCHLHAEATLISCWQLRLCAGITEPVLPPHLFPDQDYDKWGNPVMAGGTTRMRGELFYEEPVQKMLAQSMHLFTDRIKYPRTYHFPWSPGLKNDDRMLESTAGWEGTEVVATEKMDGEGTTFYRGDLHARSMDSAHHPSRTHIKAIHGAVEYDIPEGWRVCGENLTAVHSLRYEGLPSYFMVFNIWDKLTCLSWDETIEWAALLGLETVPTLWRGPYSDEKCRELCASLDPERQEGLVVRPARAFALKEFPHVVGKYVRARHVQTDEHWMRKPVEYNGLEKEEAGKEEG
jgi:RNA ligase/HNH endonuclease